MVTRNVCLWQVGGTAGDLVLAKLVTRFLAGDDIGPFTRQQGSDTLSSFAVSAQLLMEASKVQVLVVSEHAKVRLRLARLIGLEPGVGSVLEAEPRTAVLVAHDTQPSTAVVDVGLAGLAELELCEQLLALPRPPRVILIASAVDESLRQRALGLGAAAVLLKDLDTSDLLSEIGTGRGSWSSGAVPERRR